jgi:hypothetical protein
MMARSRKQPLDFRKNDVEYVIQRWRAGDSCSLVGVGSVGKSNLLQHLVDPDVHRHYKMGDKFKVITIDPALLGPLPKGDDSEQIRCWAGYELMMHRLFLAFYPFDMLSREDAEGLYNAYEMLQDGTNPLYAYMGLRYFELGLDYFMRAGIQIVFIFDEFEDMFKQMPVKFFQTLRGLRDANKQQLSYLTFTRAPLMTLVEQHQIPALEIEPFTELFTDNLRYVGPYNALDSRRMLDNLIARNQVTHTDEEIEFLLNISGGYAGLLRTCYRSLGNIGALDSATLKNGEALRRLLFQRAIQDELLTLWKSLTPVEQNMLKVLGRLLDYQEADLYKSAIPMLVQKRLIRVDHTNNGLTIEPPLFRVFVENSIADME